MFETRGGGANSRVEAETSAALAEAIDLTEATETARGENTCAALKVLAAGRFWESWIERDVRLGSGDITDCGNNAIAELAVHWGCSRTVAQGHAELGMDLRLRLPRVRAAFEAGDLDFARVRVIARDTAGLRPETVASLETEIVAAARQLTPGPLAGEIFRLICEYSPQEAAEQREFERRGRRVVRRSRGSSSVIEVTVSPEEGAQFMQLVAEMASTVCRHDLRGAQQRMADAVMAIMHGEPHLACLCEREDCTASGRASLPGRRAPLTQITVDVATLVGLLSQPAYLHGHGFIDPELARRLAADGTWQVLLAEALDIAEKQGLVTDVGDVAEAVTADVGADAAAVDGAATDAAATTDAPSTAGVADLETQPVARGTASVGGQALVAEAACASSNDPPAGSDPEAPPALRSRYRVRSFLARGGRRRAGYVPDYGPRPPGKPCSAASVRSARSGARAGKRTRGEPPMRPVPLSLGTVADAILAAVRADPTLALGQYPNGHGGLPAPPDGALTYRPDAATVAMVRARDGHCRFPGCARPADACQVDHIVEFRIWDPAAGGWTIVSNLECLCAFHHQLKTLRLWNVVALRGHALLWTSSLGTSEVTLPAGAQGSDSLAVPGPRIVGSRGHHRSANPEEPPSF
ncbi:HNH endonuclease signature motif containing protein [Rhodococcus tukisamuensis]|uniref:DUF222 domain-containing protein n=1 Tax=Rhodococcus tukisamuensis TaxID=168276 RepID=A0A1G6P8E8_9NOCA|nr:HNH endonuclease signature motif containing protein [Rhodococcus tukisamuensis]SDC76359.1 protein of unknown function [Rhodococcus tukisamuensis]